MHKIFIDGSAGTTGLKIFERLSSRKDLEIITLPDEIRKDLSARKDALNSCDVAFLCLPDAAAIEAVSLIENPAVRVIDTSTAHRTNPDWAYGFPELKGKREQILNSKRIAEYESKDKPLLYDAPRQYALGQEHKHLPEIKAVCGLDVAPLFCPIVADFPCGMEVTVPIFVKDLNGSIEDVKQAYKKLYVGDVVKFNDTADESGFLSAGVKAGKDSMEISVFGNDERILLVSRFDNLGKGASGAAIQNMNIILGEEETTGLVL